MSRKPEDRIDDIVACCEKILRFTSGMNQTQFFELEDPRKSYHAAQRLGEDYIFE